MEVVREGRYGSPLDRLDRVVVLVATSAAGVFFTTTLAIAVWGGRDELLAQAMIPGAVLAVGIPMLLLGRPNAMVHLLAASAAIVVYVGVFEPFPNAELGILSMGLAGVLFVRRRYVTYVAGIAVALFSIGLWWGSDPADAANTTLVFAFVAWLFAWLKRELEKRQEDLGRLSERYRGMFQRAPIPMWELDLRPLVAQLRTAVGQTGSDLVAAAAKHLDAVVVVAANQEAAELMGPAASIEVAATPFTPEAAVHLIEACRAGVEPSEMQVLVATPSPRHLLVTFAVEGAVHDFGPERVLLSGRDITDVVEEAQSLESLVAAKDQFIATVSHELRTPITAVLGLTQELRDRFDEFDREEVDEFVRLVAEQGSDVAHIVEDLLVAARAGVGTLALTTEPLDLSEVERLGPLDTRPDQPLVVQADPGRLRQILRNLRVNAERYGGPNRRMCVFCRESDAVVEVRDDGDPIPQEERTRIFEAYQTVASVTGRPGSVGLGLTVSRQLARLMGGDLTYSHDGAESVFSLRLPLPRNAGANRPG